MAASDHLSPGQFPEDGLTLYRGEGSHEQPSYYPAKSNMAGGWWTTNAESASRYAKSSTEGKVYKVNVSEGEAEPRGLPGYYFIKDPAVRQRRELHTGDDGV